MFKIFKEMYNKLVILAVKHDIEKRIKKNPDDPQLKELLIEMRNLL